MNVQTRTIRVLLFYDDEDDYVVVRDLLSEISSIQFSLKWVSDFGAGFDNLKLTMKKG